MLYGASRVSLEYKIVSVFSVQNSVRTERRGSYPASGPRLQRTAYGTAMACLGAGWDRAPIDR